MGKKSQKYYAVKKGLNPGVYTTWKECLSQELFYSWLFFYCIILRIAFLISITIINIGLYASICR